MRRMTGGVLVCALLGLWGASVAAAKGQLPKGFPYAAEVRISVTYQTTYTRDATFPAPCADADGNTVNQTTGAHEQEAVDRTFLFKHVTVPVVPAWQLGRAAARLALKPTITDPGQVTGDNSSWTMSGTTLDSSSGQCPEPVSNYDCQGQIRDHGLVNSILASKTDGFDPELYSLLPVASEVWTPNSCSGVGGGNDVAAILNSDAGSASPQWEEVNIHTGLTPYLYSLRTKSQVVISHPPPAAEPCAPSDAQTCSQSITGLTKVTIKRLFLHRTKRSYRK